MISFLIIVIGFSLVFMFVLWAIVMGAGLITVMVQDVMERLIEKYRERKTQQ